MPRVRELYGHALGAAGEQGHLLRDARCPHTSRQCDGGGNRDMARWPARGQPLASLFSDRVGPSGDGFIPCGVCSVRLPGHGDSPLDWAVCPNRLFALQSGGASPAQAFLRQRVLELAGFRSGDAIRVWSEVVLRDTATHVNYRLDYVLKDTRRSAPPVVVEVMTASSAGGNKREGTDIKTAFCNAVLYAHGLRDDLGDAPGVNTRQVWARMASQLIVKSEIANAWGSRTIWIIQDTLLDYIRANTRLHVDALQTEQWAPQQVNVISANLTDPQDIRLFAGPIRGEAGEASWTEILSAPGLPAVGALESKLDDDAAMATIEV